MPRAALSSAGAATASVSPDSAIDAPTAKNAGLFGPRRPVADEDRRGLPAQRADRERVAVERDRFAELQVGRAIRGLDVRLLRPRSAGASEDIDLSLIHI